MNKIEKAHKVRWNHIQENINDIRDYNTMIYIGAAANRKYPCGLQFVPYLKAEANYMIDVLEIWKENVKDLIEMNKKRNLFRTILKGDVRQIGSILNGALYDVVVWWHGPEHIRKREIPSTLKKLEKIAKFLIILGMPYAVEPKKSAHDNPYEDHKCTLHPKYFDKLNYKTDYYGEKGTDPNNLLAWKRI